MAATQLVQQKRVACLGMGASGNAAGRLAARLGAQRVLAIEAELVAAGATIGSKIAAEGVECYVYLGYPHAQPHCDTLVVSPGVPVSDAAIQHALINGTTVLSELSFAAQALPPSVQLIAITGTNGKTSCATFCASALRSAGVDAMCAGNIGIPLSELVLDILDERAHPECVVLEVSSFQLELPHWLNVDAAAITNLSSDHIDRHGSLERYARSKLSLLTAVQPTSGVALITQDEPVQHLLRDRAVNVSLNNDGNLSTGALCAWVGSLPGVQMMEPVVAEHCKMQIPNNTSEPAEIEEASFKHSGLVGKHTRMSALIGSFLAKAAAPEKIILQSAIDAAEPIPHRMQLICETWLSDECKLCCVNDSKSTNVHATLRALESLADLSAAIVLLGGQAKQQHSGSDGASKFGFDTLCTVLEKHHNGAITFGADGASIAVELQAAAAPVMSQASSLEEGVEEGLKQAMQLAVQSRSYASYRNITLLFSPGCASFDAFASYAERGDAFIQAANAKILETLGKPNARQQNKT